MKGQISLEEYITQHPTSSWGGCGECICRKCLYWWSNRCPYGECYDDHRAEVDPYDKAHPDRSPRTWWSDWDKPGEQAHWCRGGTNYPAYYRPHFVKYKGQQVKHCLFAAVGVFQDGYISCSLVDAIGCEECYRRFIAKQDRDAKRRNG